MPDSRNESQISNRERAYPFYIVHPRQAYRKLSHVSPTVFKAVGLLQHWYWLMGGHPPETDDDYMRATCITKKATWQRNREEILDLFNEFIRPELDRQINFLNGRYANGKPSGRDPLPEPEDLYQEGFDMPALPQ